jgi:hypothetical protein
MEKKKTARKGRKKKKKDCQDILSQLATKGIKIPMIQK